MLVEKPAKALALDAVEVLKGQTGAARTVTADDASTSAKRRVFSSQEKMHLKFVAGRFVPRTNQSAGRTKRF